MFCECILLRKYNLKNHLARKLSSAFFKKLMDVAFTWTLKYVNLQRIQSKLGANILNLEIIVVGFLGKVYRSPRVTLTMKLILTLKSISVFNQIFSQKWGPIKKILTFTLASKSNARSLWTLEVIYYEWQKHLFEDFPSFLAACIQPR